MMLSQYGTWCASLFSRVRPCVGVRTEAQDELTWYVRPWLCSRPISPAGSGGQSQLCTHGITQFLTSAFPHPHPSPSYQHTCCRVWAAIAGDGAAGGGEGAHASPGGVEVNEVAGLPPVHLMPWTLIHGHRSSMGVHGHQGLMSSNRPWTPG
jgi:hypothetical protein